MWHSIALKFLKVPEKRKILVKKLEIVNFDIKIVYWRHLNQKLSYHPQSRAKPFFVQFHYTLIGEIYNEWTLGIYVCSHGGIGRINE